MSSQHSSPYVGVIVNPSARRVACDQCHAQKLRCTKLDNSAICVRCQRLNRQCIWSPPSRSGRPARGSVGEMRRKRPLAETGPDEEEDAPAIARNKTDTNEENGPLPSVTVRQTTQPPSAGSVEVSEAPPFVPVEDWNLSDIFNISSPCLNQRDSPFQMLWTPPDTESQASTFANYFPTATGGDVSQINDTGPHSSSSRSTEVALQVDSLHDITQELSNINLSLLTLDQSLHSKPWGQMFESPATIITKLTTCGGDGGDGLPDETLTQGYPLVEIFDKTQSFIEAVKRTNAYFASLHTHPSSITTQPYSLQSSRTQTSSQRPSRRFSPESNTSSHASSPLSAPMETYLQPDMLPPQLAPPLDMGRSGQPTRAGVIDLPTALLLTTGYARMLDLYITFLTQMSHFVQALSVLFVSGGPDYRPQMHPVIPPLQWGAFQPANFGTLQMLMVVQVVSYLLTEVERALGVDEWEREVVTRERSRSGEPRQYPYSQSRARTRRRESVVGDGCRTGNGRGLLSPALIEIVVQAEGGTDAGSRRGKIGLLRRKLRSVKRELEQSMHI